MGTVAPLICACITTNGCVNPPGGAGPDRSEKGNLDSVAGGVVTVTDRQAYILGQRFLAL